MNAPVRLYASQFAYDMAEPDVEPETPTFDSEVGELMIGCDTSLMSFKAFADAIEEEVYEMLPPRQVAKVLLAACRSKDPSVKLAIEGAKPEFESLAERMLEKTWKKECRS